MLSISIDQLLAEARKGGVNVAAGTGISNYINTIPVEEQPEYPGNLELERRIRSAIRWNAIMTVLRASKKTSNWAATWRPSSLPQPFMMCALTTSSVHATSRMAATGLLRATSPRAFTLVLSEGRLTQEQLDNFRQEVHGNGLSSYPHPKLMPEFWQFPTVSMGLGPIGAIYRLNS